MTIDANKLLESDIATVKWQLNVNRVNLYSVIKRCKFDYPSIVLLFPVRDIEKTEDELEIDFMSNFNPLWVSCPYLRRQIDDLKKNMIDEKIANFIFADNSLKYMMFDAQANFYNLRKNLYRNFLGTVSSVDENSKIFNSGICGNNNPEDSSCLEIHYAHYHLCKSNMVGLTVLKFLDNNIYCEGRECSDAFK